MPILSLDELNDTPQIAKERRTSGLVTLKFPRPSGGGHYLDELPGYQHHLQQRTEELRAQERRSDISATMDDILKALVDYGPIGGARSRAALEIESRIFDVLQRYELALATRVWDRGHYVVGAYQDVNATERLTRMNKHANVVDRAFLEIFPRSIGETQKAMNCYEGEDKKKFLFLGGHTIL